MKKNIKGLEFVRFTREDLGDFREYILPHVYEQLLRTENFEDDYIVAIAALVRGVPAGAVIAKLIETEEIFIFSMVVARNYRGVGIGNEFIEDLIQVGLETYPAKWGVSGESNRLFIHTEYALSGSDLENFEGFLKSAGFTDFTEKGRAYRFDISDLKGIANESPKAHCFTGISGATEESLTDFYHTLDVEPALKLSFFTGTEDDPELLMLMQYEGGNLISLSSVSLGENPDLDEYKKLLATCLNAAAKENPDYSLIASTTRNLFDEFWAELGAEKGTCYVSKEAGLYVMIESEEDRAKAAELVAKLQ